MREHQYQCLDTQKIAYLLNGFPRLSETFILREILELEQQGTRLHIFALFKPSAIDMVEEGKYIQAPVTYLPHPRRFPHGTLILMAMTARRLLKTPWRLLRTCLSVVIRSRQPSALRHLLHASYLADQLERERITHLHAHYANTPATIAQFVYLLTGISYSFTAHAYDIYLSSKASLAYKMKMASFVVTCTGYNQQYLSALVDRRAGEHIHRIYHGLDTRIFPTVASTSRTPPLILSVARLTEKKGLSYLIRACRLLADQGYNFTCRIVGEGPLHPVLEQEIRELKLTERVELQGAEPLKRVIEMYQQATIMALPCIIGKNGDRDGIPNVLIEALYMEVPVISTPVSGIPELITSEVNGLLVPPNDSMALAGALARLLDDSDLRDRLAASGRQKVLEQFDMASNTTQLRSLLFSNWE